MALPLILTGASMGANALGAENARAATIQGAETAADIQRMGTKFAQRLFNESLAREQPFIQAGQRALPLAELAASGKGNFRSTPVYQNRQSTGLSALGGLADSQVSPFAAKRFNQMLDATEEAMNLSRLNDLISIGLGSSGTAGQQGTAAANEATRAAILGGQMQSGAAQTAFEQRQNMINGLLQQGGGLSSYLSADKPSFFPAAPESSATRPTYVRYFGTTPVEFYADTRTEVR